MDIALTLMHIRPGEEWTLDGETYDGLTWHSKTEKPTEAELKKAWKSLEPELLLAEENKKEAKDSALKKLAKLGLTEDEISALIQ